MSQVSLLTKGPKFCPTARGNFLHMKSDTQEFTRKLKLMEKFHDSEYSDDSVVRKPSNLNVQCDNEELTKIISELRQKDPSSTSMSDNLTIGERSALQDLKTAADIVIKKADKGNTLVVMDTEFYRDKLVLLDHLYTPTYSIAPVNSDRKVFRDLTKLVEKHRNCLTEKETQFILKKDWKSSNFYVLPKIHKNDKIAETFAAADNDYAEMDTPNDLKGRPITAGPNTPTRGLSELLEKILAPFVPKLKTYVKDDRDFVSRIPRFVNYDCELLSWDVVSLYTSIPHELGIEALNYWLTKYPDLISPRLTRDFVLEATLFVLQNNYFMFDGTCYHQNTGSAMGAVFSPPYACLAVGYLEEVKLPVILPRYFPPDDCVLILKLLLRYIDDGFAPWPKRLDIKKFMEAINLIHPDIKFTIEVSTKETRDGKTVYVLTFLDVKILLFEDGHIETDIFYKDTNNHDYLDYRSHHPTHTKNNIVYTLAKKIVEFVSNYETENERLGELEEWLIACNYPRDVVKKGIHNARLQGPGPNPVHKKKTLPFVSTHYSNINSNEIVKFSNNLIDNVQDERLKSVFNNTKVVLSLKQPPNLLRQLTRAEFNTVPTSSLPPGIFTCTRPNCYICKFYLKPCKSFMCSNGKEWFVRSHITCQSRNTIYFLKCISCNFSTTYSGKATTTRGRTNNHISECRTGRGSDIFDKHVFECNTQKIEPAFELYIFVELSDAKLMDSYENYFHKGKYDTMNR